MRKCQELEMEFERNDLGSGIFKATRVCVWINYMQTVMMSGNESMMWVNLGRENLLVRIRCLKTRGGSTREQRSAAVASMMS